MELVPINEKLLKEKMPNYENRIAEKLGAGDIYVYSYYDNGDIGFIAINEYDGLLITSDCKEYCFGIDNNGLVYIKKNDVVLLPKVDYVDDEFSTINDNAYEKRNLTGSIFRFAEKDNAVYSEYNKDNDTFLSIVYKYDAAQDKIYLNLLNIIETVHIYHKYSKNRGRIRPGIIPSNLEIYSRDIYEIDTYGYDDVSKCENGFFNTLINGADNYYDENYLVRYSRLKIMRSDGTLDEPPLLFRDYYKEDELFSYINELGFNVKPPEELVALCNNEDKEVLTLKKLLPKIEKLKR